MLHPLPPREPHLSKESTPFPNCVTRWESSVQMCESIGNIHTQTGTATLQDAVSKAHGGNWLNSTALPLLYLTLPLSLPVDPGIAKKQVSEKPFILHLFLGNRNQVVR